MCLGAPGKIVSIDGLVATVDFFGVQKAVNLHIVDEPVEVGDYILNHVGYAIRKIPADEIEGTIAMYRELLDGPPGDLMREDVEGEQGARSPRAESRGR